MAKNISELKGIVVHYIGNQEKMNDPYAGVFQIQDYGIKSIIHIIIKRENYDCVKQYEVCTKDEGLIFKEEGIIKLKKIP